MRDSNQGGRALNEKPIWHYVPTWRDVPFLFVFFFACPLPHTHTYSNFIYHFDNWVLPFSRKETNDRFVRALKIARKFKTISNTNKVHKNSKLSRRKNAYTSDQDTCDAQTQNMQFVLVLVRINSVAFQRDLFDDDDDNNNIRNNCFRWVVCRASLDCFDFSKQNAFDGIVCALTPTRTTSAFKTEQKEKKRKTH